MIEIRNMQGQIAELHPDASISIEKNNSLFNERDKFFEDITYPFKMPATDANKVFFEHGHLVEAENKVYELEVQCIVSGLPFYAGLLSYSFTESSFAAVLKINFGALADKTAKVSLADIYTGDGLPAAYNAAHMKTVCENPADYHYSFFPIYNAKWDEHGNSTNLIINNWNHAAQLFTLISYNNGNYTACSPFFKLKHVLTKVFEYLGFKCTGSWINDPASDHIYIYSRLAQKQYLFGSTTNLPKNLKIADFLKIVRERFTLAMSFNLFTGMVEVYGGASVLSSTDLIDIRPFISSIIEIGVPDEDGFTITLDPDESDELFLDPINTGEKKHIPTSRLVIGKGQKSIEMKSSTLKRKVVADYSMPSTAQNIFLVLPGTDFPLRFLRYTGMKTVAGGKFFPEAHPLELDESDAIWPKFMNDSKKVKLLAHIPVDILSKINSSSKLGITTTQGKFEETILERMTYSLKDFNEDLISTTIECRTIAQRANTSISIQPIKTTLEETNRSQSFKAYFSIERNALEKVAFEIYYPSAVNPAGGYMVHISYCEIIESTDAGGGLGSTTFAPTIESLRSSLVNIEIRVRKGVPKFMVRNGVKLDFINAVGYYYIKYLAPFDNFGIDDSKSNWIVF